MAWLGMGSGGVVAGCDMMMGHVVGLWGVVRGLVVGCSGVCLMLGGRVGHGCMMLVMVVEGMADGNGVLVRDGRVGCVI